MFSRAAAAAAVNYTTNAIAAAAGYHEIYFDNSIETLAVKASVTSVITYGVECAFKVALPKVTKSCCGLFKKTPAVSAAMMMDIKEEEEELIAQQEEKRRCC